MIRLNYSQVLNLKREISAVDWIDRSSLQTNRGLVLKRSFA